jgi:hypothetical protein
VIETSTARMIGLSRNATSPGYADIDYALAAAAGGTLLVYERGANRGSVGTYVSGDRLRIAVEDGVVRYRKNGVLLYTSQVIPSSSLVLDGAIFHAGGTIANAVIGGRLATPEP